MAQQMQPILYDTTLRDGEQHAGVNFIPRDKIEVAKLIDDLGGIKYIELGYPGSNPTDEEVFRLARDIDWKFAKPVAFGSTRRRNVSAKDDLNLQSLVRSRAPVVTIFGKTEELQLRQDLGVSNEQNLAMIEDSIAFLKSHTHIERVYFDAEHFFTGARTNMEYALACLFAAVRGGADGVVLCDTRGDMAPFSLDGHNELDFILASTKRYFTQNVTRPVELGVHMHQDRGYAVANSMKAMLEHGYEHVQGTFNSWGERVGNAGLTNIIPELQLKAGFRMLSEEALRNLTSVALRISELAGVDPSGNEPYVGLHAFAHKGGAHTTAILKCPKTYEHINPELVGNTRNLELGISGVSGTGTISALMDVERKDPSTRAVLDRLKGRAYDGYRYGGAAASLMLMVMQEQGLLGERHFKIEYSSSCTETMKGSAELATASVMLRIGNTTTMYKGQGKGQVDALWHALQAGLQDTYKAINGFALADFRVRDITPKDGSSAKVQVRTTFSRNGFEWSTIGLSNDLIAAALEAITDGLEYGLLLTEGRLLSQQSS